MEVLQYISGLYTLSVPPYPRTVKIVATTQPESELQKVDTDFPLSQPSRGQIQFIVRTLSIQGKGGIFPTSLPLLAGHR